MSAKPAQCVCGSWNAAHGDIRRLGAGRVDCKCGRTGPWAKTGAEVIEGWNKMQRALRHFDGHEAALKEIHAQTAAHADMIQFKDMGALHAIADDALKAAPADGEV